MSIETTQTTGRVATYLEGRHQDLEDELVALAALLDRQAYEAAAERLSAFEESLRRHMRAEEALVFPVLAGAASAPALEALAREHHTLRNLVGELRVAIRGRRPLACSERMEMLTDVLLVHLIKERRALYPAVVLRLQDAASQGALVAALGVLEGA